MRTGKHTRVVAVKSEEQRIGNKSKDREEK